MTFNREMQKALEADGEKLRQLTGEDHGPYFVSEEEWEPPQQWYDCGMCGGEGELPSGRMSHSVNSATIEMPFEIMEPCPHCNGVGGWLDDAGSCGDGCWIDDEEADQ